MKKRIMSLVFVVMMLMTLLPTTIFATESEMSEEFASILNADGNLEITWSCDDAGMQTILSDWVLHNKPDVNGYYSVGAYNPSTKTVNLIYSSTNGNVETHEVGVVVNEEFTDGFRSVLEDGKIVLPTTSRNISYDWLSQYLYYLDDTNTYAFMVASYQNIPLINEDCTRATIKMYRMDGRSGVEYHTVELSRISNMSDNFKSYLDSNGNVYLNAAPPQDEFGFWDLFDLLLYEEGVTFYNLSEDFTKFDLSIDYELHTINVVYDYDVNIAKKIRPYLDSLPMDTFFAVRDLELVNYWVNNADNDEVDTLDAYSGELKEYIGYNNIKYYVDNRMGMDEPFYTERAGVAIFSYEDVVYYSNSMLGTNAEHIIYVPTETANTSVALMEAAQKRINEYVGFGKAELESVGTVKDVMKLVYPDISEDELQYFVWVENVTLDEPAYELTVKGNEGKEKTYYIIIKADSNKMITPKYETADIETEIMINSNAAEIPLDTKIYSEKLTSGTEYEKIIHLLDVETNETYDISLYSDSLNDNVTKLENGSFEVKIPLSDTLKDKNLVAYYVDTNNEVVEYKVTVKEGYACFTTDHFSIYTIAPAKESSNDSPNIPAPEPTDKPTYEIVVPKDNAASGKVTESVETLKVKIPFTAEEKALIDAGAEVKLTLEVKDIEKTVSATDKALVETKLNNQKVGMYLDINLYKKIGENSAEKVTELNGKMKIQITVPDTLINTDVKVNREYKIIQIHNEVATELDAQFDATTKYLTFETNHFSTYALVYVDKAIEQTTTPTTPTAPTTPITPTSPKTGDVTMLTGMTLLTMSGVGILRFKKKKLF